MTVFLYDSLGRETAVTEAFGTPDAITTTFGYDANGNQTSTTDPLGHVTTFQYDFAQPPDSERSTPSAARPPRSTTPTAT